MLPLRFDVARSAYHICFRSAQMRLQRIKQLSLGCGIGALGGYFVKVADRGYILVNQLPLSFIEVEDRIAEMRQQSG